VTRTPLSRSKGQRAGAGHVAASRTACSACCPLLYARISCLQAVMLILVLVLVLVLASLVLVLALVLVGLVLVLVLAGPILDKSYSLI